MKVYENAEKAKVDLYQIAVGRGTMGAAAVEKFIAEVAGAIPPSMRGDYDADDIIAAAQYVDIYLQNTGSDSGNNGNNGGVTPTPTNTQTTKKETVTFIMPTLPENEDKAVQKLISDTLEDRTRATGSSYIEKIYTKYPKPSTFITGHKVVPECDATKMNEYRANLVQTEDNLAAFAAIEDAVVNKKELAVNINDKSTMRVEGVSMFKATKASGKTSAATSEILTNAEVMMYLYTETLGRVGTDKSPIGVGAKLRNLTPSTSKGGRTQVNSQYAKSGIAYVGHSTAVAENNFEAICVVDSAEPTKERRVRVADTFTIYTGKNDAKGQPKTKKIRLSGKDAKFPNFVSKPEYAQKWSIADRNVLSATMTEEERSKAAAQLSDMAKVEAAGYLYTGAMAKNSTWANQLEKAKKEAAAKAADSAKQTDGGME